MDDMASKNISSCTVSYTPLLMKTDLKKNGGEVKRLKECALVLR